MPAKVILLQRLAGNRAVADLMAVAQRAPDPKVNPQAAHRQELSRLKKAAADIRQRAVRDPTAVDELYSLYAGAPDRALKALASSDPVADQVYTVRLRTNPEATAISSGTKKTPNLPHELDIIVVDQNGKLVTRQHYTSGSNDLDPNPAAASPPLTKQEQLQRNLLTHTEQKAMRDHPLRPGWKMIMLGRYPPCTGGNSCTSVMQQAANQSQATYGYLWPGGPPRGQWYRPAAGPPTPAGPSSTPPIPSSTGGTGSTNQAGGSSPTGRPGQAGVPGPANRAGTFTGRFVGYVGLGAVTMVTTFGGMYLQRLLVDYFAPQFEAARREKIAAVVRGQLARSAPLVQARNREVQLAWRMGRPVSLVIPIDVQLVETQLGVALTKADVDQARVRVALEGDPPVTQKPGVTLDSKGVFAQMGKAPNTYSGTEYYEVELRQAVTETPEFTEVFRLLHTMLEAPVRDVALLRRRSPWGGIQMATEDLNYARFLASQASTTATAFTGAARIAGIHRAVDRAINALQPVLAADRDLAARLASVRQLAENYLSP